ncbi:MAG: hypothetical protein IT285_08630 [Bdellovibrionales bacterium]|nr:hypothetical protein [Bdellovibrionales bacterium]
MFIGGNVAPPQQPQQTPQAPAGGAARGAEPTERRSFQETWDRIQAQYGKQPEKQREVKKTLDKDDFMRIMITQMQHQDPTKPFDADKMASEIAQITSFEALSNVGRALDKLSTQSRPLERLAMTSLIGKEITVDRSRFTHEGGKNSTLSFQLPQDAASVKVALISDKGEVVLEKDLGPRDQGEASFTWDGKQANTVAAPTGIYLMKIAALDSKGNAMQVGGEAKSRVIGVSFQGQDPVFIVGDATKQTRVPLDSVVQIDDLVAGGQGAGGLPPGFIPPPPGLVPQAQVEQPAQAAQAAPAPPTAPAAPVAPASSGMFTFQRGVGSMPMNGGMTPEQRAAAINGYQAQMQSEGKGFPNGMAAYGQQEPQQTAEGGEGK